MPIQQQAQPGVYAPIPQQQAIADPSNQLALIEPYYKALSSSSMLQLALPAPTQEEDERTAEQILGEMLLIRTTKSMY
jgi:hypothetical protein